MRTEIARTYSAVFAPELFVLLCSVLVIGYEWRYESAGSLAGLGIGVVVIWIAWRVRDWGVLVPEYSALLVAVTVPHLLVTPFWDISSHVLYALVPAGYLLFVDSRFVPLVVLAVGMVVARPLAGAHTWLQSLAGAALAVASLVALSRLDATATRGPTVARDEP